MVTDYQELEKLLKIKFKNLKLLEEAFIHRSYLNEARGKYLTSNERLEFLGDSILSFITSEFLYHKFPNLPEGDLTSYRSALVCAKTLSCVAKKLNLGAYLKMSKGEKEGGGMENPTLLANTVEALIGAIYLDQGIETVKNFIANFILTFLPEIIKNKAFKDFRLRSSFSSADLDELNQREEISFLYDISKKLFFRFKYWTEDNREWKHFERTFEFGYNFYNNLNWTIFSQPFFRKEYWDLGTSILWKRDLTSEYSASEYFRLAIQFDDFIYNQKNVEHKHQENIPYGIYSEANLNYNSLKIWYYGWINSYKKIKNWSDLNSNFISSKEKNAFLNFRIQNDTRFNFAYGLKGEYLSYQNDELEKSNNDTLRLYVDKDVLRLSLFGEYNFIHIYQIYAELCLINEKIKWIDDIKNENKKSDIYEI